MARNPIRTRDTSKVYPPGQTGEGEQITVEFRRTKQFECEGRRKGPKFYKGERYQFDAAFAHRWIRRGVAFDIAGPAPEPEEEAEDVDVSGSGAGERYAAPTDTTTGG